MEAAKKTASEVNSKELTDLKTKAEADAESLKQLKLTAKNLRNIGRNFREKHDKVLAEKTEVVTELESVKATLAAKEKELEGKIRDLEGAQSLMESMSPETVAKALEENDTLKEKNVALENKLKVTNEKAKSIVLTAQAKIKKLQEVVNSSDEKGALEAKIKEIEALTSESEKAAAEKDQMKAALESAINKLRKENEGLKNSLKEVKEEKEKQQEQLDQLQLELQATAKPVAVAGVVHQQEPRKQVHHRLGLYYFHF